MKFLKYFYSIPFVIFVVLNVIFLIIITIMNIVGKSIVWVSDYVAKIGDFCGDESGLNDIILKFQTKRN